MKIGLLVLLLIATCANARDIHVGKDVPTIAHAIKAALPGDVIHLEPKVYRDYAGFYNKKGEPGKPITLDGHGATLEGSDPLDPTQWTEVSPGLFSNANLIARNDDAIIGRWFFLWNGQMQHMGRTSKGRSAPLKKTEELQPGEWTFVKDPSREKPPSKQVYGTFYLKLPAGQKLADANIFAPMRSAGVQFSGDNAHLIIRNLTATHPYNDGFNIHGDCREVVFENIGFDLFFLDEGRYTLTNALVISSAQNPLSITGRTTGDCRMQMKNVFAPLKTWRSKSPAPPPGKTASSTANPFLKAAAQWALTSMN
ncbi:MAG: hypothetical protein NTY98_03825 [Verrucomicrobia bacterium]|nr:hypothetical protein [Verrucomicrobiota bacterium]